MAKQQGFVRVVSSINPIYQILEAIGKQKLQNHLLIKPNSSEHDYFLKRSDLEALSKADLIFYIDHRLEKNLAQWITKNHLQSKSQEIASLKNLKILNSKKSQKSIDYHIWLDPENAIMIASFFAEELCKKDQTNCIFFKKNLKNFIDQTRAEVLAIKASLRKAKLKKFIIFHDGYRYFEDYFALEPVLVITDEDGQQIRNSAIKKLNELAAKREVGCIFASKNESSDSGKIIANNYGLKFIELKGLGEEAADQNSSSGYVKILENLAIAFQSCV